MRAGNKVIKMEDLIDIAFFQGGLFEANKYIEGVTDVNPILTIMVNTSASPVILVSRMISYTGNGVFARIYREPVYDTPVNISSIIRNVNDINPETPVIEFYNANIINYGTETRASRGVFGNQTGSGGGDSNQVLNRAQIMKPGQTYLLEIVGKTSNSQDVDAMLEWIEIDNIPGIELDENGNFVQYTGVSL